MHIAVYVRSISMAGDVTISRNGDSLSRPRRQTLAVSRRSLQGRQSACRLPKILNEPPAGCRDERFAPRADVPMMEPTRRLASRYEASGKHTLTYQNWWASLAWTSGET